MANNPVTYEYKCTFKDFLNSISYCKRVALRPLPVDFFVHFMCDLIVAMKNAYNYRMLCIQNWDAHLQYYKGIVDLRIQQQAAQDWADCTVELFEQTAHKLNVPNIEPISKVYKEFLLSANWLKRDFCIIANSITH